MSGDEVRSGGRRARVSIRRSASVGPFIHCSILIYFFKSTAGESRESVDEYYYRSG